MSAKGVPPGAVAVCKHVYADDEGLVVGRDRYHWRDVARLTDGYTSIENVGTVWVLEIVLRTGKRVHPFERDESLAHELAAAVGHAAERYGVAERYGIAVNVTGIPVKDGRPPDRGVYVDAWGGAGVRFWDGSHWSRFCRAT
jgi:hypothetical protein